MNTKIKLVVYDPPHEDFPFLAVLVSPDGTVSAEPFDTAAEAEAHIARVAMTPDA